MQNSTATHFKLKSGLGRARLPEPLLLPRAHARPADPVGVQAGPGLGAAADRQAPQDAPHVALRGELEFPRGGAYRLRVSLRHTNGRTDRCTTDGQTDG